MSDKRERIAGMRFEQRDDGDGFIEIRVRIPATTLPGTFRGVVEGNDARKFYMKWALATARGLIMNVAEGTGIQQLFETALVASMDAADREQARWDASGVQA